MTRATWRQPLRGCMEAAPSCGGSAAAVSTGAMDVQSEENESYRADQVKPRR